MDERTKQAVLVLRVVALSLAAVGLGVSVVWFVYALATESSRSGTQALVSFLFPLLMLAFLAIARPLGRWAAGDSTPSSGEAEGSGKEDA